jgi:hypothetical protein
MAHAGGGQPNEPPLPVRGEAAVLAAPGEGTIPSVGFGDVHPTNWPHPVRAVIQPRGQILEMALQRLPVGSSRRPVYARGGVPL